MLLGQWFLWVWGLAQESQCQGCLSWNCVGVTFRDRIDRKIELTIPNINRFVLMLEWKQSPMANIPMCPITTHISMVCFFGSFASGAGAVAYMSNTTLKDFELRCMVIETIDRNWNRFPFYVCLTTFLGQGSSNWSSLSCTCFVSFLSKSHFI